MYTVDMDMQPKSGLMSNSAQMPQKANRSAMAIIRRLSVERFLSMADKSAPKAPPSTSAARLVPMGRSMFFTSTCPPFKLLTAMEMAMEYATRLTTSSSATTCSKVFTKSPFAPVWRMVIMVDAGAVALASAAKTMENARDSPSTR